VNACWERSADADADALGLPKRFLPAPPRAPHGGRFHPLGWRSSALVESDLANGSIHVSGALREEVWLVAGGRPLERRPDRIRACGALSRAFAAVYYRIDLEGNMQPGPLKVRGFLMDSGALCEKPAKSREFLYQEIFSADVLDAACRALKSPVDVSLQETRPQAGFLLLFRNARRMR